MRTIYAKITPKDCYVRAEICYKSNVLGTNLEIQVASKDFGFGFFRLITSSQPTKKHYEDATDWVNEYLKKADRYGSDQVIEYEPQWKKR